MTLIFKKVSSAKIDRPSILYHQVTTSGMGIGGARLCPPCGGRIFPQIPVRFVMVSLILLATSIDYITRVNINIAIVTMVQSNSSHSSSQLSTCPVTPESSTSSSSSSSSVSSSSSSSLVSLAGDGQSPSATIKVSHGQTYPGQQFDWSPTVQGIILGSFWYSYILMQIPSGRMAEEFGGKMIVAVSLIGSGVINLITPFAAPSVTLLVISRMALGFIQGGIFPSCYAMIGKWMPMRERSLGFAFMEIGATVGSVIATTSSGYLSEHGFAGGWPSVFYVSGTISILAFFLWSWYSQSDPTEYVGISECELKYIQANDLSNTTDDQNNTLYYNSGEHNLASTSTGAFTATSSSTRFSSPSSPLPSTATIASPSSSSSFSASVVPVDSSLHLTPRLDVKSVIINGTHGASSNTCVSSYGIASNGSISTSGLSTKPSVPWRLIMTSPAVISILISKFSLGFSYSTLLSKLPSYLHDVLHIPPTQNGLLNASLYMTTCISLLTASHVSERMINERILTRTACRKLFLATASIGTALCFSFIPWAACDTNLVMLLLLCGNFFLGLNAGGDVPVPGELTVNFPATIYAMGNMFGCSTGFIAPYVIGVILESGDGKSDLIFLWSKVYYLAAAIALTGAVVFVLFGDANRQAWDNLPEDMYHLSDFFHPSTSSPSETIVSSTPVATAASLYHGKRIQ